MSVRNTGGVWEYPKIGVIVPRGPIYRPPLDRAFDTGMEMAQSRMIPVERRGPLDRSSFQKGPAERKGSITMANSTARMETKPTLTVDVLIPNEQGELLVIRRGTAPFKGMWCWPGGMVDPGETVKAAGIREVKEETGLTVTVDRVVGIYSELGRDPRGQYVSIALLAHPVKGTPQVTEEATEWKWAASDVKMEMGFDHARIRADHYSMKDRGHGAVLA